MLCVVSRSSQVIKESTWGPNLYRIFSEKNVFQGGSQAPNVWSRMLNNGVEKVRLIVIELLSDLWLAAFANYSRAE